MDFTSNEIIISLLFFIASTIHTSLGFGGGSSYSAIQAGFGLSSVIVKGNSLICNTIASGVNILQHLLKKQLHLKKALLFTAPALPFTFIGSYIKTDDKLYIIILGLFLILTVLLRFYKLDLSLSTTKTIMIAIVVGFISGYVGIGGGILLAPFIVNKTNPRASTSVTSIFIFSNSVVGLIGNNLNGYLPNYSTLLFLLMAFLGTLVGNYISFKTAFENKLFLLLNGFLLFIGLSLIWRGF